MAAPADGAPALGNDELMLHIKRYLETHPEAVKELGYVEAPVPALAPAAPRPVNPPAASKWPAFSRSRGARTAWRRGFYALVMIGLCGLLANVLQVHVLERNTHRAQVQVVEEVRQNRGWLTKVLVVQALLITFNVVVTIRGVKVWMLLRRIKLGQLLREINLRLLPVRWTLRQVRRTGAVLRWTVRPLGLPFKAIRVAQQQRAALAKAKAAKRAAASVGSVFAHSFATKAMVAA